jgi:2-amino-4-hydroxy-6-hydroxymethyldihydropteridine diphosphokinase
VLKNMSVHALIGLGANLGQARETIERALEALNSTPSIQVSEVAPFYGSDPVDAQGPTFVNTVARIQTDLAPLALLEVLQALERTHGRERSFRNAPRTLDLDLLWYEDIEMETARLTLPHPRMHERAFVLKPLNDLMPEFVLKQGNIAQLLAQCCDQKLWPL